MHAWDAVTPLEETLRFLDDAVSAGKISYYGFSNYLGWQVTKAVHTATEHGWTPPVTLQPQYNLLVRDIEHEVVPACLDGGLGLLPWSPLAGGWLTGKYQRDTTPTGRSASARTPSAAWRRGARATSRSAPGRSSTRSARSPRRRGVTLGRRWRSPGSLPSRPSRRSSSAPATSSSSPTTSRPPTSSSPPTQLDRLTEVSAPQADDYPYGPAGVDQRHRALDPSATD